ncbi:hypothetical protein [Leeuwenhoekiella sp. H156]|uniref:hypothetical protein n=1 Tax=Leeuwenhoekiella sp. H156 TaxID=3450128 RepID=UPI003FA498C8
MNKVYKISLILLFFCMLFNQSCSSDSDSETIETEEPNKETFLATLNTVEAKEITAFSAVVVGKVEDNGGSSVREQGICYALTPNPDYNSDKALPSSVKGSGEYEVKLTDLTEDKVYYARAFAKNSKGISYGNEITFTTAVVVPPSSKVKDIKVSGAHDIWVNLQFPVIGEAELVETGMVYGLEEELTIEKNSKAVSEQVISNGLLRIKELEADKVYFMKPYAITKQGRVYYGELTSYATIKEGNFTWSFNGTLDPANENHSRIKEAFETAMFYYNNFTSITKHVTVNYSPGTPTADANLDGWINMGAKPSYQRAGTAMHEMAHSVGIGTHGKYWELMTDGTWDGKRTLEILDFMTEGKNTMLYGDRMHIWPYGINGANEDSGDDMLYTMHVLVLQGMKSDGLPSSR